MITLNKKVEFTLEWLSTFIILLGATLTSINAYPMNVYLSLAGNFGWLIVSISWKRWSLIVIQAVITVIYVTGLINTGVIHL